MQVKYNAEVPQAIFPASQAVVNEAIKFFKKIFNTHYVPEPVMTSARIWEGSVDFDLKPSQQFGYGVHQWAIGADDRKVMEKLIEPLPNLFTCGEAFSDYQGWVEGALRSTDLVMGEGFNLKPFSEVFIERVGTTSSQAVSKAYYDNATKMIQEYVDPNYQPEQDDDPTENYDFIDSCIGIDLTYIDQK